MPPPGPVAPVGARFGARAIDTAVGVLAGGSVALLAVSPDRPLARLATMAVLVWCYETTSVVLLGTTPGKRAFGLRPVVLDASAPARPHGAAAARRGAVNAAFTAIPILGWLVWAVAVLADPLRRGPADRAAGTIVVPAGAWLPVRTPDLPGFADGIRRPRLTALGRVGELDVRARVRLRRLVDAPALTVLAAVLALGSVLLGPTATLLAATSAVWLLAFVVDEARATHRALGTPAHRRAGLVVLDVRRGGAPSRVRSVARATVLGLTLYLPWCWPFGLLSAVLVAWSPTGRGLHDRVAGTVVVADPQLDPEEQRQRTMRVRLGLAG